MILRIEYIVLNVSQVLRMTSNNILMTGLWISLVKRFLLRLEIDNIFVLLYNIFNKALTLDKSHNLYFQYLYGHKTTYKTSRLWL